MSTENPTPETAPIDPKAALIRKGLILVSTAVGIALATGVKLPKKKTPVDIWADPFESRSSSDVTPDA